jgi:hypothetical protein
MKGESTTQQKKAPERSSRRANGFIVRIERPPASRLKRSQVLAVAALALILFAVVPVQEAAAQAPYTEKLNVYVAGNSALWYFTFGGINGSSKLAALESSPGLSWYNITMVRTTLWQSDFQIFGPRGYNLLPFPFIPSQGMFLTVGSDSFSDASAAAAAVEPFLLTTFTSFSNGTGSYTFYSPLSFNALAPTTLLRFLPTSEGGFVNALSTSGLESTDSPFIVYEGLKSASGFAHTLVVGSISSSAIDSTSKPTVMSYFGSTVTALTASAHSGSSVIQMRFLDGIVRSTDSATVTSDNARFTGSYTLTLAPGKRVSKVNATVVELPDPLLATRAVDVGVLHTNDNIAVTLTLRNLATSETITKVNFSDNWWSNTGMFKFLSGNYIAPSTGIAAGATITPVYRLQYTGTVTETLTIPASVVRYSYSVGSFTFNATAVLNPIRISLGADDAVLETIASPLGGLGASVGAQQKLNVTVINVGTLPASSVLVAGRSIPGGGLAARSGTSTVTVTGTAASLTGANATKSFSATYQDPAGTSLNATSNVVPLVFSHTSLKMGSPALTVTASLATLANQETNLTLSFATSNMGPVNVTSFSATAHLPAGLGCGALSGKAIATKGVSCSGGELSIRYPVVNASAPLTVYMKYNLTTPSNYLMGPIGFVGSTSKSNVTGISNAVAIPAGLVLTKQFSPTQLFGGMKANVVAKAVNSGPGTIYNANVTTSSDSFDTLSGSASLSKGPTNIAPGGNVTFSFGVTSSQEFGNLTGSTTNAAFYFGGTDFSVSGAGPKVDVYQPLSVSISTIPTTPEEGKNFTISIKITNPTGVDVSNVVFKLPLPSGLGLSQIQGASVSGGVLTFSPGSLAAHNSATATASAVASSGITIPFDRAQLTFQYAGTTINGILPSKSGIAIGEDVTTRYIIPTAFILLAVLGVAFYVRWKATPSVPASPQ